MVVVEVAEQLCLHQEEGEGEEEGAASLYLKDSSLHEHSHKCKNNGAVR
jgi:hypothetical protein